MKKKKPIGKISKLIIKSVSAAKLAVTNTVTVSIGENCLTDAILDRHGLKSFTTPYSHGRSNIDYAIALELTGYSDLLNLNRLTYGKVGDTTVIRYIHNLSHDPIFIDLHRNGFEFTHHDIIHNKAHRDSCARKINRLLKFKGKKNFRFFYHYRISPDSNLNFLFRKAERFLSFYDINGKSCELNIFTQKIVPATENRRLRVIKHTNKIRAFVFETHHAWAGENHDLFWAINDDDLIQQMLHIADSTEINESEQAAGVEKGPEHPNIL